MPNSTGLLAQMPLAVCVLVRAHTGLFELDAVDGWVGIFEKHNAIHDNDCMRL